MNNTHQVSINDFINTFNTHVLASSTIDRKKLVQKVTIEYDIFGFLTFEVYRNDELIGSYKSLDKAIDTYNLI